MWKIRNGPNQQPYKLLEYQGGDQAKILLLNWQLKSVLLKHRQPGTSIYHSFDVGLNDSCPKVRLGIGQGCFLALSPMTCLTMFSIYKIMISSFNSHFISSPNKHDDNISTMW